MRERKIFHLSNKLDPGILIIAEFYYVNKYDTYFILHPYLHTFYLNLMDKIIVWV